MHLQYTILGRISIVLDSGILVLVALCSTRKCLQSIRHTTAKSYLQWWRKNNEWSCLDLSCVCWLQPIASTHVPQSLRPGLKLRNVQPIRRWRFLRNTRDHPWCIDKCLRLWLNYLQSLITRLEANARPLGVGWSVWDSKILLFWVRTSNERRNEERSLMQAGSFYRPIAHPMD